MEEAMEEAMEEVMDKDKEKDKEKGAQGTTMTPTEAKPAPSKTMRKAPKPKKEMTAPEKPKIGNPENVVVIGGHEIEIKPTKLKYHRNNTAYFYKVVQVVPLPDLFSFPAGTFGDDRTGDKALFDWMVAVTDEPELISKYLDDIDTETVEKMLEIFLRVNKIAEKEEAQRKNSESREAKA